jgi:hypothetical protein
MYIFIFDLLTTWAYVRIFLIKYVFTISTRERELRYPNDNFVCFWINKEEQAAGEVPFGSPGVGPLFSQVRASPCGYAFFFSDENSRIPIRIRNH